MGRIAKQPLSVTHPRLLEQWDYDKNVLLPDEITYGSGKKVWWKCNKEKCGYSWQSTVNNRTSKKSYGQLYRETLNRLERIEKAGYMVVYIWEKDYVNGED
jgi:hypothetical protein